VSVTLRNVLQGIMLVGSLAAVACGGAPSASEICHDSCHKQASCNSWTNAELSSCYNECSNQSTNGSDSVQQVKDSCKNADAVISVADECVKKYCNQTDIDNCLNDAIGMCEAK